MIFKQINPAYVLRNRGFFVKFVICLFKINKNTYKVEKIYVFYTSIQFEIIHYLYEKFAYLELCKSLKNRSVYTEKILTALLCVWSVLSSL